MKTIGLPQLHNDLTLRIQNGVIDLALPKPMLNYTQADPGLGATKSSVSLSDVHADVVLQNLSLLEGVKNGRGSNVTTTRDLLGDNGKKTRTAICDTDLQGLSGRLAIIAVGKGQIGKVQMVGRSLEAPSSTPEKMMLNSVEFYVSREQILTYFGGANVDLKSAIQMIASDVYANSGDLQINPYNPPEEYKDGSDYWTSYVRGDRVFSILAENYNYHDKYLKDDGFKITISRGVDLSGNNIDQRNTPLAISGNTFAFLEYINKQIPDIEPESPQQD